MGAFLSRAKHSRKYSPSCDFDCKRPAYQMESNVCCDELHVPPSHPSDTHVASMKVNEAGKAGLLHTANCLEEFQKTRDYSDSSIAWVKHICQKFVGTFMARSKNSLQSSGFGIPDTNMPCEALLKLVMAVLDDKNPEEVAMLVELMLKKVIEEFGQRPLHLKGQEFPKKIPDRSEQYTSLQQEVGSYKSMDGQCAMKLESQNNELKELKSALESMRLQFRSLQSEWEKEMETLNRKLYGLAQAAAEYHKVVAENRDLYNQVQDLKGNIRVYCRVRPFLSGQNGSQSAVDLIGDGGSIVVVNPSKQGKEQRKSFTFNKVFGPCTSQEKVFLDTQPLIRSVLDGYNVCIFAYGQTGSGKTYTMAGPNNPCQEDWGVNFRALHDLFEICELRENVMRYEVGVQMIEIYNEQVRDLLCMDGINKKLEIRNNSQQNGLNVPDAKLLRVRSTEEVLELMIMGQKNRAVGATALNERSSRSHSVLTVHVKGTELASGCVLRGCLHLVDLAGSERVEKSEATGDRLKEAQHINKSLSALGDVIAALAQRSPHVPYRNSKLTQLLQDSLGGQAKTLMFVHVSPESDSFGETMSTLKFAERVATVELGAAHANKESVDVKDLKNQIAFLKDALAKKDMELGLFQKEFRLRGFGISQDRLRAKTSSSELSMATGYGNQRLSLDQMPNLEVCESPGVAERSVQSTDPLFSLTNYSGVPYAYEVEEDTHKRRASEAASPDSRSSSGATVVVSSPASTARIDSKSSSKKNKIRHGSFDELDSFFPGVLCGEDDLDEGSELDMKPNVKHGNSRMEHSKLLLSSLLDVPITRPLSARDLQALPMAAIQSTAATTKVAADTGDSYFTEDDETISDYSEADSWQMAGTDQEMSVASFGKRRKEGDRRFLGQQQPGHLAKRPITTSMQPVNDSPKKHGSASVIAESTRMGGKASSETKARASKRPI